MHTPEQTYISLQDVTALLGKWTDGNHGFLDQIVPLVYKELHHMARLRFRGESKGETLQATGLVNEAYLKLKKMGCKPFNDRQHFIYFVSDVMRRIMVDRARTRLALKRRNEGECEIDNSLDAGDMQQPGESAIAVHQALERLAEDRPRAVRIVDMKFFLGMTHDEIAEVMNISKATVKREWNSIQPLLKHELTRPHFDSGEVGDES